MKFLSRLNSLVELDTNKLFQKAERVLPILDKSWFLPKLFVMILNLRILNFGIKLCNLYIHNYGGFALFYQ